MKLRPNVWCDKNVSIGEYCAIGQPGFMLEQKKDGSYEKAVIRNNVIIHNNVNIASHTNVDAGHFRDTIIETGTMIDSHCHISHDCHIGKHCKLGPGVILLGEVTIGDYSTIWTGAIIHQKTNIGKNCMVGANSYLRQDLPDKLMAYGTPAKVVFKSKYPRKYFE